MGNEAFGWHSRKPSVSVEERNKLVFCLQRADALLAGPAALEHECDSQFTRAGPDANDELRRVELRRLLHTFSRSLGAQDLTWETIEASAIVGTLDPEVPVVTRPEFFRCALKTVHLVAAEVRARLEKLEEQLRLQAEAERRHTSGAGGRQDQPRSGSSSSRASSSCSERADSEQLSGSRSPAPPEASAAPVPAVAARDIGLDDTLFEPAGGVAESVALVDGMTAMALNVEGSFDAQRLYVGHGTLVLSNPDEAAAPSWRKRFFCGDGRSAFDLTLLEDAATGPSAWASPVAAMLPGFAVRGKESLDRVLLLGFVGGEALCLWFSTKEDCARCFAAVRSEARVAADRTGHADDSASD